MLPSVVTHPCRLYPRQGSTVMHSLLYDVLLTLGAFPLTLQEFRGIILGFVSRIAFLRDLISLQFSHKNNFLI